jgi:hypothetical protein
MTDSLPITCTLPPSAFAGRVSSIAALNRGFLRSHRHVSHALELVYEPSAAPQLRDLIQREQECCAFLRFELHEAATEIRLTISVPLEARDAAEVLFAPFLVGVVDTAGGPRSRVGAAAMTAAGVAVACGVCWVLPFAAPAVALTAFGGFVATLAGIYWWALSVAVGVVVAGWLWIGWQSLRTGRRTASSTLRAMAVATMFLGVALSWSFVESRIIAALRP